MFKQKRLTVLSMAVLLALLVAAIMPFAAFADDGAPPPPDAPVVEVAPTEAPVAEEPSADVPIVDAAQTEAPVVDEPVAEAPAEVPTVPEVLAQVPDGTDVVVLDESGQSVPLTSLAAADAILTSDPMWCPAAATKVTLDCRSANTVHDLLIMMSIDAVPAGPGVIYFTSTYSGTDATFDGNFGPLAALKTSALTLQGGWTQAVNVGDNIVFSGSSVFSVPVAITNWKADVTVNDFTIIGKLVAPTMTTTEVTTTSQPLSTGLTVTTTTGDVVLNRVESDNNTLYGIDIQSTGSGNVSLNDVIANNNSAAGVQVHATGGALSVVSGQFNGNGHLAGSSPSKDGLNAFAKGGITLNKVIANSNKGSGAELVTGYGSPNANGPIVYCSHFENNTWSNIDAAYESKLTLNGVTFGGAPTYGDIYMPSGTLVRNDAYDCTSTPCVPTTGTNGAGDSRNKNQGTGTTLVQEIASAGF